MKKSDFDYVLPQHLIAQQPLTDRSASRMLRLDRRTGAIQDDQFIRFIDQFNENDLLVFNDTKVIPARLFGHKSSGGKVEILIERILSKYRAVAHVRANKSLKPGTQILLVDDIECVIDGKEGDLFYLSFNERLTLDEILEHYGHVPLPPYINRTDDAADLYRYQTVFAKTAGAVAAPTAGLHFDQNMLVQLEERGVQQAYVTLHVGSGTFQPVRVESLSDHVMHKEFFAVPSATVEAVAQAKTLRGRVVAIGTTSVRALESAAKSGQLQAGIGDTDLFITPGYQFRVVDALLTNFHLPESTLLMLVSAFAGFDAVRLAYQHAIAQHYRFFSYGDAMLIS